MDACLAPSSVDRRGRASIASEWITVAPRGQTASCPIGPEGRRVMAPFLPPMLPFPSYSPLSLSLSARYLPSRSWPWHGRGNDGERRQGGGGPLRPLPCLRATSTAGRPASTLLLLRPPTILHGRKCLARSPIGAAAPRTLGADQIIDAKRIIIIGIRNGVIDGPRHPWTMGNNSGRGRDG